MEDIISGWSMDIHACAHASDDFQVLPRVFVPLPAVHLFMSLRRWWVSSSDLVEDKMHPARLLGMPSCTYTRRPHSHSSCWPCMALMLW